MHGFELIEKSIDDFLEFCERLEVAEQIYEATHKKPAGMPETGSRPSKRKRGSQKSDAKNNARGDFYCMYHGYNTSHTTDECKLLKPQVERMCASHEAVKKFHPNKKAKWNQETADKPASKDSGTGYSTSTDKRSRHHKHPRGRHDIGDLDNFNYDKVRKLRVEESESSSDESH